MLTGGQYSVVRALTGVLLAVGFARLELPWAAAGLALTALFTLGFFHRAAAVALAFLLAALTPGAPSEGRVLALIALALHASLPPKPYGALATRGATDPGSTWAFPKLALIPLWAALVIAAALTLHPAVAVVGAAALIPRIRPLVWLALLGVVASRIFLSKPDDVPGFWMALLLTFEADFVKPQATMESEVIFYDGSCGLCHGFVRFVLSEDKRGAFRFAPLQSETFTQRVPEETRKTLPDSIVVTTSDGRVLSRSAAVLHVAERLGGLWGLGSRLARVLPQGLRDWAYDRIARIRHKLFKKPTDACPLMPKELRARFLY